MELSTGTKFTNFIRAFQVHKFTAKNTEILTRLKSVVVSRVITKEEVVRWATDIQTEKGWGPQLKVTELC